MNIHWVRSQNRVANSGRAPWRRRYHQGTELLKPRLNAILQGDWSPSDPFPSEGLDMIASYANIVRTSLQWDKTEPEQGVYNWTYLDGVMEELYSQRNVTVLFILGLWNRAYCPDLPRSTWPSCSPTEQWQVDAFV